MSLGEEILKALEPYNLKGGKQGEYRSNSPLRSGSDSDSFAVRIEKNGGAYFDHVTGEGGTLEKLAEILGIEVENPSRKASKRSYVNLDDYAHAHGVTRNVLEAAGWAECEMDGRRALSFQTANGVRYRFMDGKSSPYKSPYGYKACWYKLDTAVRTAKESPLVLCNGEISTDVAQYYGIAACAMTTGSEHTIRAELLTELKAAYSGRVVVALDGDATGRQNSKKLVKQLEAAGFEAQAVDLGVGDEGQDLADFCKLWGQDSSKALGKLVKPHKPFIEWVRAGDLQLLPSVQWLVEGEIPERGLVVLFGQPGIGKSFVALDYCLWISRIEPVLYVAAEGYRGFADRVRAWVKHFKYEPGALWFASGDTALRLLDPIVVEQFVASAEAKAAKLIVFDTLAWAMVGGDENTVKDMQQLINHCRIIQERLGVAVMLVHHSGKANTSERGSSALRGGADIMIEVVSEDDLIALVCSKSKDAEPFAKRWLRPIPVAVDIERKSLVLVHSEGQSKVANVPLSDQQRTVLDILSQPLWLTVGARASQLAELMPKVDKANLYRLLNKLLKRELISQEARGEPFRITAKGLEALAAVTAILA